MVYPTSIHTVFKSVELICCWKLCELVIMMNDERYKTIIATLTANVERHVFRQIWYISEATS